MGEKIQGPDGIVYEVSDDDNLGLPLEEEKPAAATAQKPQEPALPDEGQEPEEPADNEDDSDDEDLSDEEAAALEAELDAFLEQRVEARIKPQLAGRDRQITALQQELKARDQRMAEIEKQLRENKLIGLSEEDQQKLRQQWDFDDKMAQLKDYETANNDMYLALLRMAHVQDNGDEFGFTEADLEGMSEEEMDKFVVEKELAYWRAGGPKKAAAPAAEPKAKAPAPAAPARKAPAGASAPSDLGGDGAAPKPQNGVAAGTGPEAMALTLKGLKTETVRLYN